MYETTSFCGLECTECPACIATQAGDMQALEKLASDWSSQFGMQIAAENVMCDGCKSDTGRLSGYCTMCEVRSCAVDRAVVTCAHCDDYGCEKLLACPAYEGKGKELLEKIRAEL